MANSPVIDADVMFSAPQNCIILESLKEYQITITVTSDLLAEYNRNCKSMYTMKWLSNMESRGRIKPIKIEGKKKYFSTIISNKVPPNMTKIKAEMLKDLHLFCAAIRSDQVLISKNTSEAKNYKRFLHDNCEVMSINWVNPQVFQDEIKEYIRSGLLYDDDLKIKNTNF